jgi:ESCRT-II complex subunit VPS36
MTSEEWTPFHCLPKAALTASGLLQLDSQDHEVELIRRSPPLELRCDGLEPMEPRPKNSRSNWQPKSVDLTIIVTTHRLVLLDNNSKNNMQARFLHLSNMHQVQASGGVSLTHWNASYKLILSTYTYGDLVLAFRSTSAPKDRDAVELQISKALERKAWQVASRLQEKQKVEKTIAKRKVGVDHILAKNKLKHKQAAKLADEALGGDAEQLLGEAAELLQIIQKYVKLLQKREKDTSSGDDPQDADAQRLASLLQDMGMTSALTKTQVQSSNKRGGGENDAYHELLARQVADFLLPKLPQMGGILTLTDVFCLFNRARGTNLISPEDLAQACHVLNDLSIGISQRTFPSGIIVLQLDSSMDQSEKLVDMCPTTALEASHVLQLSPLLAMEQLEEAERMGLLCRDVTLETTRFYPNRFAAPEWAV